MSSRLGLAGILDQASQLNSASRARTALMTRTVAILASPGGDQLRMAAATANQMKTAPLGQPAAQIFLELPLDELRQVARLFGPLVKPGQCSATICSWRSWDTARST